MPRDVVNRAFEPFFTTKPKGEGSGLGLATVYGIITQAGGHVQIYSEPGIGTTLRALLPVTDVTPAPVEHEDVSGHRTGGGTVLVVEDEEAIREVARRILVNNGYEVLTAGNGPEALAITQQYDGTIDLLVTDVVMPVMLGRDVADRFLELRPGARVLFVSGYAQPVLASQGTLDEGVTLLEKPFTERALVAKIREVLDSDG
jgi:CheY-like chemotaxis protein